MVSNRVLVSVCLLSLGVPGLAEAVLVPQDPADQLRRQLEADFRAGNPRVVADRVQQALARFQGDPSVYRIAGIAAIDANRLSHAVFYLDRAVKESPGDYLAWTYLGRARALQDPRKGGEAELRRAIGMQPDQPWAYLELSRLYMGRAQADEALAPLQEGLARPKQVLPEALRVEKCRILHPAGRFDELLKEAGWLVEHRPAMSEGHYFQGLALSDRGETEKAGPCFREAISRDPDNARYHLRYGTHLQRTGNLPEALTMLRKAKSLDESDPQIRYALAMVLARLGQREEAKAERAEFLRLNKKPRRRP